MFLFEEKPREKFNLKQKKGREVNGVFLKQAVLTVFTTRKIAKTKVKIFAKMYLSESLNKMKTQMTKLLNDKRRCKKF